MLGGATILLLIAFWLCDIYFLDKNNFKILIENTPQSQLHNNFHKILFKEITNNEQQFASPAIKVSAKGNRY
jgi:hypothetical protein